MTLTFDRIKVMSTIASYLPLNISETVRVEAWFQRTINKNDMWAIKWSCDRWRHVTLKGQTRDPNTLRAKYREQLEMLFSNNR